MSAKPIDLTGHRYGRLTVIERVFVRENYLSPIWKCVCDCGTKAVVHMGNLRKPNNPTRSCGCLHKEALTTHGLSKSPEYAIWKAMKDRCYNEKHPHYDRYGGRGITVSDEWKKSFEIFYKDMGPRPSDLYTIEREENDKGYSKENCKWATMLEQTNNTSKNVFYTLNGVSRTLAGWGRELNINPDKLGWRLRNGWSIEEALQAKKR